MCQRSTRGPRSCFSTTTGLVTHAYLPSHRGCGYARMPDEQVTQVVDDEQVVGVVVQIRGQALPLRVVQRRVLWNERAIRTCRLPSRSRSECPLSTIGYLRTTVWAEIMSWPGIWTQRPVWSYLIPWYMHRTLSPSASLDRSAPRCGQRSLSAMTSPLSLPIETAMFSPSSVRGNSFPSIEFVIPSGDVPAVLEKRDLFPCLARRPAPASAWLHPEVRAAYRPTPYDSVPGSCRVVIRNAV